MKLFFYLDELHWPDCGEISFDNSEFAKLIGTNTWLNWTVQTFLYLKESYDCELVREMPQKGIVFFFRGSVGLNKKPSCEQFWVCFVADSSPHPYAHMNVVQNRIFAQQAGYVFMHHWPQRNIVASVCDDSRCFKNIAYMGDLKNLPAELQNTEWIHLLESKGFRWIIKPADKWNDYSDVDAVVAVRSFNSKEKYLNKPASKLINSWHGHVPAILGRESAYIAERKSEFDYLEANTKDDIINALIYLKQNCDYRYQMISNARCRSKNYSIDALKNQWVYIIEQIILPSASKWNKRSRLYCFCFNCGNFLKFKFRSFLKKFRS